MVLLPSCISVCHRRWSRAIVRLHRDRASHNHNSICIKLIKSQYELTEGVIVVELPFHLKAQLYCLLAYNGNAVAFSRTGQS